MVKKELAHHPDVLFLQVLRYDFDSTSEGSKKVKRTITLSPTLVVQGATYHLIFVTFHSGSQASQGHYTCRAKEPFSKLGLGLGLEARFRLRFRVGLG